jgi:hypothetical protein
MSVETSPSSCMWPLPLLLIKGNPLAIIRSSTSSNVPAQQDHSPQYTNGI